VLTDTFFLAAHRAEHTLLHGLSQIAHFLAAHRAEHYAGFCVQAGLLFLAAHRAEHGQRPGK